MNIKSMMEKIESILEASSHAVEEMPDGSRLQIKELAQIVGLAVAMEPKHVLNFVNHFVHNTDLAYVTRGKNGGIIRGVKTISAQVKNVKKSKKVIADISQ